jgi:hypothetical protein
MNEEDQIIRHHLSPISKAEPCRGLVATRSHHHATFTPKFVVGCVRRRHAATAMISIVEDFVARRLEQLCDRDGRYEVSFSDGHARDGSPDRIDGLHRVTLTTAEQRELRRLCVGARYRGRAWARSWIDAVHAGLQPHHVDEIIVSLKDASTMRPLLEAANADPYLAADHPDRERWLDWYERRLVEFGPPELCTEEERQAELFKLVEFFDVVFKRIKNLGPDAIADVRKLAYRAAKEMWALVVQGADGYAASRTRKAVGRLESKAGLSQRSTE